MSNLHRSAVAIGFFLSLTPLGTLAASLSAVINDQDGNPVDDAVIYIELVNGERPTYSAANFDVDQLDKTYVPHVRVITKGSTVSFPNSDDIRHHVYSFSDARTFELPLYIGTPAQPVLFDEPGVVDLGCNIHDFMRAYILVLETPFFAKTVGGQLQLDGFADGTIDLMIWHPRMSGDEILRQEIEITGTHQLQLEINLRGESNTGRAPKRRKKRY
tara:strand:- start:420 stop:1067 length:648 start_codon:yes stop_codon:yes gene_type:complete